MEFVVTIEVKIEQKINAPDVVGVRHEAVLRVREGIEWAGGDVKQVIVTDISRTDRSAKP